MSDLWIAATADVEAETAERYLTAARVNAVEAWKFLTAAVSREDFENRRALVSAQLDTAVEAAVGNHVAHFASTRVALEDSVIADFEKLHTQRMAETQARNARRAAIRAEERERRKAAEAAAKKVAAKVARRASKLNDRFASLVRTASGGDPDKWYVFGGPNDSPQSEGFDTVEEARAELAKMDNSDGDLYVGTGFPDLSHLTGHESSRRNGSAASPIKVGSRRTTGWNFASGFGWVLNPIDTDGRHWAKIEESGADYVLTIYELARDAETQADAVVHTSTHPYLDDAQAAAAQFFAGRTASRRTASTAYQMAKETLEKFDYFLHGIDAQSANAIVTVYEAISPENQAKFDTMSVERAAEVAWKLLSRTSSVRRTAGRYVVKQEGPDIWTYYYYPGLDEWSAGVVEPVLSRSTREEADRALEAYLSRTSSVRRSANIGDRGEGYRYATGEWLYEVRGGRPVRVRKVDPSDHEAIDAWVMGKDASRRTAGVPGQQSFFASRRPFVRSVVAEFPPVEGDDTEEAPTSGLQWTPIAGQEGAEAVEAQTPDGGRVYATKNDTGTYHWGGTDAQGNELAGGTKLSSIDEAMAAAEAAVNGGGQESPPPPAQATASRRTAAKVEEQMDKQYGHEARRRTAARIEPLDGPPGMLYFTDPSEAPSGGSATPVAIYWAMDNAAAKYGHGEGRVIAGPFLSAERARRAAAQEANTVGFDGIEVTSQTVYRYDGGQGWG